MGIVAPGCPQILKILDIEALKQLSRLHRPGGHDRLLMNTPGALPPSRRGREQRLPPRRECRVAALEN
jgi:hypothetical protein